MADIVMAPEQSLSIDPTGIKKLGAGAATTATLLGDVNTVSMSVLQNGQYYVTKEPTTADINKGIACVCLRGVPAPVGGVATVTEWKCAGDDVLAAVDLAAEALAIGDPLYLANGVRAFKKTAAGAGVDQKIMAFAKEVVASTTARVLVKVFLNGYHGFGATEA